MSDSTTVIPKAGLHAGMRVLLYAFVLMAVAFSIATAGYQIRTQLSPLILIALSLLAFAGLLLTLALISGVLVFRAGDKRQLFHDAVADATGTAFVVMDGKGRAVYANTPFMKLAGQSGASRLVGFDVLFAGYPDFAEAVYQLGQAAKMGDAMQRDVRVAAGAAAPGASETEPRWLRLSVAPVVTENAAGHVIWRLDDITADRRHQEDAFARLQFIITYLDNAPAGFFSTLANGKVDYLNATLAGWLGVDLAASQGSKVTLADLVGEDVAKQLTSVTASAGGGVTERFLVSINTKAGVALPVEIVHRVDLDNDGKLLPMRSMVLRRETASDTETAGDLLREIAGSAPFGIAELDDSSIVRWANASFLALSDKFAIGAPLASALPDNDKPALRGVIQGNVSGIGERKAVDVSLLGGVSRAVQLTFVRHAGQGNPHFVFAVDKTESRALEVQLAQSQKMQAVGQLASGIAHDFNNVLTPIIGFADLLLTKMRPTDPSFADVMNIKQNANRAANLVRQLLAFSRKQTMQPRIHSLTEAMSDLGNLLGRVLGEKVELSIVHSRDLGLVLVDIHQFEQVIINLAVNARDAMPSGGKLHVRTYNLSEAESQKVGSALPPSEYVVCEIKDTGTGIPAEILDKIWEPFFSTKEVGKGTGLGLSMVYGIIKQTGGFIFVDSVVGEGTTFRIYLPRQRPEAQAVAAPTRDDNAKRADFTGKGRILVVEDEDSVRAFAVRALGSRGYTVLEANSGEIALDVIASDESGFELILSDVVMPEMDGPSMLAELRKRGITTKIIFMSGYAEDAFERNLENPDDFAFLQKPFSLKQLIEKVKDVMG